MPIVLRIKGYKFRFYKADLDEPPHVHVIQGDVEAKFWLSPVRVARSGRFRAVDLREIERIIEEHHTFLVDAWNQEKATRADE